MKRPRKTMESPELTAYDVGYKAGSRGHATNRYGNAMGLMSIAFLNGRSEAEAKKFDRPVVPVDLSNVVILRRTY